MLRTAMLGASRRIAGPAARAPIARLAVPNANLRMQKYGIRTYAEDATKAANGKKSANDTEEPQEKASTEEQPAEPVKTVEELQTELTEVRGKYEAKDKDAARFKEAYQNSLADFKNLQKTTEKELQKARDFALQKFAKDLIDTVDNFDLTMGALKTLDEESVDAKTFKDFVDGVKMVQGVLEKTLEKHGISKLVPMGEKYDPNVHEAIFQVPQEGKEPGTIFHVDRNGYKLHDRVLRAPKVGIVADKE